MPTRPKTALVTGASRGLGLETSRALAREGYRVLLTSRSGTGAKAARDLAREGLPVSHLSLDVDDPASATSLGERLTAEGVRLDALVNNAGISRKGFDLAIARATLETNFFGALRVTDALLPLVQDGGDVVMVSSALGTLSSVSPALRARLLDPGLTRDGVVSLMRSYLDDVARGTHQAAGWLGTEYAVSKVGLNALVRVLAPALRARKIHLNAVCPGWVRTDMGGASAPRSLEEGAASIVWGAVLGDDGPTGGFFRDGAPVPW